MDNPRPKITLCMIVKDEHHCIERCLESCYPHIDRYDITDTGSTDGTQDIIKKFFDEKGIPGEVHQSDWKGFGDHAGKMGSRTESLHNAEKSDAEYAWVIDADDSIAGDFRWPEEMNIHSYSLKIHRGDFTWWRNQVFKLGMGWKYSGILHEYANCDNGAEPVTSVRIDGNYHVEARTEMPWFLKKQSRTNQTIIGIGFTLDKVTSIHSNGSKRLKHMQNVLLLVVGKRKHSIHCFA